MHAAKIKEFGQAPVYAEVADLPPPTGNQVRVKVLASSVHRLVKVRAAGTHYSAKTAPLDPSTDGIVRDEADGALYYSATFAAPMFAQYANVDRSRLCPVPSGADSITLAALVNPVSASWMALRERVGPKPLPDGFSVLILGVTGTSGRPAVKVARQFGAGRVIGAARNATALQGIDGLDERIVLADDPGKTDFSSLGHVDVVLDFVYGAAAAAALKAIAVDAERGTVYLDIGDVGGDEMVVPAQLLRSKNIVLAGAAPGSWSLQALGRELPDICKTAAGMERPADVVEYPLAEVESVWGSEDWKKKRVVFVP